MRDPGNEVAIDPHSPHSQVQTKLYKIPKFGVNKPNRYCKQGTVI